MSILSFIVLGFSGRKIASIYSIYSPAQPKTDYVAGPGISPEERAERDARASAHAAEMRAEEAEEKAAWKREER